MDNERLDYLIAFLSTAGDGFANNCVMKPELCAALTDLKDRRTNETSARERALETMLAKIVTRATRPEPDGSLPFTVQKVRTALIKQAADLLGGWGKAAKLALGA